MQLNPKTFGHTCIADLMMKANPNKEMEVYDFLKKNPNIMKNWITVEKYNVCCVVALKSVDELALLKEQILRHPEISSVDSLITTNKSERLENIIYSKPPYYTGEKVWRPK